MTSFDALLMTSSRFRLPESQRVHHTYDEIDRKFMVFSIKDRFACVWEVFSIKDRFPCVWEVFSIKDRKFGRGSFAGKRRFRCPTSLLAVGCLVQMLHSVQGHVEGSRVDVAQNLPKHGCIQTLCKHRPEMGAGRGQNKPVTGKPAALDFKNHILENFGLLLVTYGCKKPVAIASILVKTRRKCFHVSFLASGSHDDDAGTIPHTGTSFRTASRQAALLNREPKPPEMGYALHRIESGRQTPARNDSPFDRGTLDGPSPKEGCQLNVCRDGDPSEASQDMMGAGSDTVVEDRRLTSRRSAGSDCGSGRRLTRTVHRLPG
ncbi:hypothetical protein Bbelb_190790 [Branchiostoma belcheri]|nr:hypothetical protein Bbelb_190790 [Branchiostoma belcheri]